MMKVRTDHIVLLALAAMLVAKGEAFEFRVDSFKVVGNLPEDKIDEFDDGILNGWYVDNGTGQESGGALIIRSPGDAETITNGHPVFLINSDIDTTDSSEFKIRIGDGNATATSKWLPNIIPGPNEMYRMGADIDILNNDESEEVGENYFNIAVVNIGSLLAAVYRNYGVTIDPGLYIVFARTSGSGPGINQFTPITLKDTDELLLQLEFDDRKLQFDASFSVDGGESFKAPFSSLQIVPPDDLSPNDVVMKFDDWDLEVLKFVPSAPFLSIVAGATGEVVISWDPATPGFVLQERSSIDSGDWKNSSSSTNPIIVPSTNGTKFYRLLKQ